MSFDEDCNMLYSKEVHLILTSSNSSPVNLVSFSNFCSATH